MQENGYKKVQPFEPVGESRVREKIEDMRDKKELEVIKQIMKQQHDYDREFITQM